MDTAKPVSSTSVRTAGTAPTTTLATAAGTIAHQRVRLEESMAVVMVVPLVADMAVLLVAVTEALPVEVMVALLVVAMVVSRVVTAEVGTILLFMAHHTELNRI